MRHSGKHCWRILSEAPPGFDFAQPTVMVNQRTSHRPSPPERSRRARTKKLEVTAFLVGFLQQPNRFSRHIFSL
jgi:hypothetical protein